MTARGTLLPLLAGLVAAAALVPSGGATGAADAGRVPRLVFPLVAKTELWDNYGDPRPNGSHAGIDMENPWRAPVVAVEPGRIAYAVSNLGGCMLYLYGRSGTTYMYIHLNNDRGPRNDNTGRCARGTAYSEPDGATVAAGQQIAYNGDSGDADGNPHLHFEVHPNGGADVNPFRHLQRATKHLFAAAEGSTFSLGLRGRLLAAGEATIKLSVTKVRAYPGGRWLDVDPRPVVVAAPLQTADGTVARVAGANLLAGLKAQAPIAVYTTKAKVTQDALAGAPGSLTATRVTPLGG